MKKIGLILIGLFITMESILKMQKKIKKNVKK